MLFKNILIYFSSDVFNKAIPFLLLPILTKYLTKEDFGVIATYSVIVSIISIFIGLNTPGSIEINYFQNNKDMLKKYIGNILIIFTFTSIILLILSLLFSAYLNSNFDIPIEWLVLAIFISIAQLVSIINLILWRAEQNAKAYSIYELIFNIFNLALTLVFVIALNMNWEGRLLAIAISTIFFGFISFYIIYKSKHYIDFKFDFVYIKESLSYGVPLIPHSLAGWVKTGLDRIFITSLIGLGATGIYSVGYQLGTIIMVIATSMYKAWLPKLYEMLGNMGEKEKIKVVKITYLYFLGVIILTIVLYFGLDFFIIFFLDKEFNSSKDVVLFILISYAFESMYFAVVPYIFYFKKTKIISIVTLSTSVAHAFLSYYLIKIYGVEGATYASAITFGLTFILIWYSSNKIYKMPWFYFAK